MTKDQFYSNERVIGHHVSTEYEVFETTLLKNKCHRIRIEEDDVDWSDTKQVTLTPEEIVGLYDALIEHHIDDLEQLAENRGFVEGNERSGLVKEVLGDNE